MTRGGISELLRPEDIKALSLCWHQTAQPQPRVLRHQQRDQCPLHKEDPLSLPNHPPTNQPWEFNSLTDPHHHVKNQRQHIPNQLSHRQCLKDSLPATICYLLWGTTVRYGSYLQQSSWRAEKQESWWLYPRIHTGWKRLQQWKVPPPCSLPGDLWLTSTAQQIGGVYGKWVWPGHALIHWIA